MERVTVDKSKADYTLREIRDSLHKRVFGYLATIKPKYKYGLIPLAVLVFMIIDYLLKTM